MAKDQLKDFKGNVLVLSGDVPFITSNTLNQLIKTHIDSNAKATVLTCKLDNPYGYGRIIKSDNDRLQKIVEHKDANESELNENEINKLIDNKLQNPKYSNGKISDTILLSLLSIELQAELSEKLNIERSLEVNDTKKQEYLKNNLELKDKILKLQNEKN